MRIAVWHNLPSGGGKRALYDHVRGLVGRGHHVEAWCPAAADTDFLPLRALCREHVLPWAPAPARVRLLPGLLPGPRTIRREAYAQLAALDEHCRQAAAAIDAGGFDVLFANSCQYIRATPIGRYSRTPSVLYLQEPNRRLYEAGDRPPFVGPDPPGRSALAPWYVRNRLADHLTTAGMREQLRVEVESARRFGRLLVNSYFSRESALRAYGLEATVCYLGVDAGLFDGPADGPREDAVVGVGSFNPAKRIEFVIQAVGHLPPPRPRLVWVGNDECGRVRGPAAATGGRPGGGVRAAPAGAGCGRRPAPAVGRGHGLRPRLEPFGYAPLEANACGTPVVAIAEGVRETVRDGENGLVVDPSPRGAGGRHRPAAAGPAAGPAARRPGAELVRERWSLAAATDRLERNLKEVAAGHRGDE
ncbi:MAG: glycosyltransferase [Gemmataceae bacterium]